MTSWTSERQASRRDRVTIDHADWLVGPPKPVTAAGRRDPSFPYWSAHHASVYRLV